MCRRGELRPAAATLRAGVLGQLQLPGGGDHHGDAGAARTVRWGHEVSIDGAFVTLTRCANGNKAMSGRASILLLLSGASPWFVCRPWSLEL